MMMPKVNRATEIFAVIGDPVSHSLSPEIHNRIFEGIGKNAVYISFKITSSELKGAVPLLRNNLKGFNVTIPHKQEIIPYLDGIDEKAMVYGAVNTVKLEGGRMTGYNTDGYGFIKSFEQSAGSIKGKKILLVGAGGAARVAAYELLQKGCILTIANRSAQKAENLKTELAESTGSLYIKSSSLFEIKEEYDCIVNATSVGMHPNTDDMPLESNLLKNAEFVYDMVYNPYKTKFLETAEKFGCKIMNGFAMLFYQAVKAQEIWQGTSIDESLASRVYSQAESVLLNNT